MPLRRVVPKVARYRRIVVKSHATLAERIGRAAEVRHWPTAKALELVGLSDSLFRDDQFAELSAELHFGGVE